MKARMFYFALILLMAVSSLLAQNNKENWSLISGKGGTKLSINTEGIEKFKDDDVFVWVLEEHSSPITIESVPKKIYKTKSYYVINKKLRRYGIIQLLYYDAKGNVIKHFSYLNDSQEKTYKYSYPILPDSNLDLILTRCLEIIKN